MRYQKLGNTGLTVSRLCFGTLTVGPLGTKLPLKLGAALLRSALERGVNFFDTAQQYANYDYLASAFYGWKGDIVVASKSYATTFDEMAWSIEQARVGLRRNKIDIFLLHECRDEADFQSRRPALECLHQAKANGIIGALGLSTHSAAVARLAASSPEIEVIHAMYNQRGIGIQGGSLEEMGAALALARQNGKGVYTMKAIGGGALMHEAQKSLQWAFSREETDAVAVGMKDMSELITNLGWLEGENPPEAAQVKLLDRNMAFDKEPACHHCGACIERCPQQALYATEEGVAWVKESCLYCGYCIAACPWFCISFC